MRFAVLSLTIAALSALGATCLTYSEQRGDAGPWVGEVVNFGNQTVAGAGGEAMITDARGVSYRDSAIACPSKLLPGERGAFEILYGDEEPIPTPLPTLVPPLTAEISARDAGVGTQQARGEGMLVELLERRPAERLARVRVTNNAAGNIAQFSVCGIMRAAELTLLEVGRADSPPLPYVLQPGDSIEMDVRFNTFPADARLQFHVLGLLNVPYEDCCPLGASDWRPHDAGPFSLLLPPDWLRVTEHGIDSYIGGFVGDRISIGFDYGSYGANGPDPGDPAYDVWHETIGGFTAKIARAHNDGSMAVYVAGLGRSLIGDTRLVMFAGGLTAEEQRTVLQVFRSLRFEAFPQ